jgi:predicted nucleotide-binding protein
MYDFHSRKAYISGDGSFSACEDTITFDTDALTNKQWDILDSLPDSMKMEYAIAILDGDDDFVNEIESEYE